MQTFISQIYFLDLIIKLNEEKVTNLLRSLHCENIL